MSLVNKMLRDLDARRAGDGSRAAMPAAVTPLAAQPESRRGARWLGMLVVAALLGVAAWYVADTRDLPAPAAPALVAAPAPPASAAPPALSVAAAPAPAAVPGPAAAPAPAAVPEPAAAPAPAPEPAVPPAPAREPVAASGATPAAPAAATPARAPAAGARPPEPAAGVPFLRMADRLSAAPAAASKAPTVTAPANPPRRAPAAATAARQPVVAQPLPAEARIDKQVHVPTSAERAESEYRRGVLALRQGNAEDAAGRFRAALGDYPEHAAARQALAALLIDAKRFDEAEDVLRKGTELAPSRLASTMALARLKVERNQAPAALELLLKHAASGERSADYQGFLGTLLNRAGRPAEAVARYQAATRLAPGEARWWAGLGMALDAAGKAPEAGEAYQRARALPGLPADLAQHIEQRLR